ncbi:a-type inclusion protein [Anaeramoeba flamelloides]|uniref:A-type inclusion protein n=1 Tax=Anaeramoeba flamelloides TaxID=1746091 RepID=A0ABQ8YGI2_9EUKA|nr:a-type inclusion protein [Anaeramoeba flamelloides]
MSIPLNKKLDLKVKIPDLSQKPKNRLPTPELLLPQTPNITPPSPMSPLVESRELNKNNGQLPKREINSIEEAKQYLSEIQQILKEADESKQRLQKEMHKETERHDKRVAKLVKKRKNQRLAVNQLQAQAANETLEIIREMKTLNESVLKCDGQMTSLKEELTTVQSKSVQMEQKNNQRLSDLNQELDRANSKNQNLQIHLSSFERSFSDTIKSFDSCVEESKLIVSKFEAFQKTGKKKYKSDLSMDMMKEMKEDFQKQHKDLKQMESDYNNLSRIMNNKSDKISKYEIQLMKKREKEKKILDRINKLELKLKKEKEKNITLSIQIKSSDFSEFSFQVEHLKSLNQNIKKEYIQLIEDRQRLLQRRKVKEKYTNSLNFSNIVQVKKIREKLTSKLSQIQQSKINMRKKVDQKKEKLCNELLPKEMESYVQMYKSDIDNCRHQIKMLESMMF